MKIYEVDFGLRYNYHDFIYMRYPLQVFAPFLDEENKIDVCNRIDKCNLELIKLSNYRYIGQTTIHEFHGRHYPGIEIVISRIDYCIFRTENKEEALEVEKKARTIWNKYCPEFDVDELVEFIEMGESSEELERRLENTKIIK